MEQPPKSRMSSLSRRAARRGRLIAVLRRLGRGRWFVRRLSKGLKSSSMVFLVHGLRGLRWCGDWRSLLTFFAYLADGEEESSFGFRRSRFYLIFVDGWRSRLREAGLEGKHTRKRKRVPLQPNTHPKVKTHSSTSLSYTSNQSTLYPTRLPPFCLAIFLTPTLPHKSVRSTCVPPQG